MGRELRVVGTVLDGRYRILGKLGEGAMGEVYLAEHLALGRKDAIKILQPELASTQEFVERFRREARAANRVQHPNIVTVHDFGRLPDGRFLLAMEYVEGEPLGAVLRKMGTLPLSRALHVLAQLADAMDHAHSRGVIHRDLKPNNMILAELRGEVDVLKILDFGIAKIVAPDYKSHGLTRKGEIFGTPLYMAPEQCLGQGIDPRCDLYAIGCIAFELLVGDPPFTGKNMEVMVAHVHRAPDPPSARRPAAQLPPALEAIILRCLEKEPARRFQTGRELLAALKAVPGFPARRSGSDRLNRLRSIIRPSDFEAVEDTTPLVGGSAGALHDLGRELMSGGPQPSVAGAEPVEELGRHVVLRELAELVTEAGMRDLDVVIGVDHLRELEAELARCAADLEATEAKIRTLEQAARGRQAPLRFALSELVFERSELEREGRAIPAELAREVHKLEQHLARISGDHEGEVARLVDDSISIVAKHARVMERMEAHCDLLAPVVERAARALGADPRITPLLSRLVSLGREGADGREGGGR